jgi:ATP-dependent Lon protease
MAWTAVGGVLLQVEVNVLDGTGKVEITGLIGDVMKESAHAALSYIRSRAGELELPTDFYKNKDIHIHVPEGATPKDGPSAGVTMTTAIISALTGIPVKQCVAMTGEVTLRGDVLAIGGLKEKSLAALKEGISTIVVPAENHADVTELPEAVRNGMEIIEVSKVDEVLAVALAKDKKK